MSVVRIEALAALAALIELRIPEVAGHVCVGIAPPSELEAYPNVSIQPTKWMYEPEHAWLRHLLPGNRAVYNVGEHESACVVSVMATNSTQRAVIEAKIVDLFLGSKHPVHGFKVPGCIILPINSMPELGAWFTTFDLESDEWTDTLAMDRRYESRIIATVTIPALTVDTPVYTISQLILGVTPDLTSAFTPATAIPPAVELVTINDDGTIETWTP